jgi:hypothetical protein
MYCSMLDNYNRYRFKVTRRIQVQHEYTNSIYCNEMRKILMGSL